MIHENREKNSAYTVYQGDLEELAEQVTRFCHGEYGDKCEFYSVEIERTHPDGGSWTLHEFPSFDENAARAVKNHLQARRDSVRVEFGGEDRDYQLEFLVCKARNTSQLARYVKKEHMEEFDEDDIVVLTVERKRPVIDDEQRRFLEKISK